jgi:hypothetical protein
MNNPAAQPATNQPATNQPATNQPATNQQPPGGPPRHGEFWSRVQQTRAWAGALVVFLGAGAITGVTLWGLTEANSTNTTSIVAILSSAFTAIATMITAYFGIRAVTNTAQSAVGNQPAGNQPPGNQPPGNQPPGNQPPGNQPPGNQPPGNQPAHRRRVWSRLRRVWSRV